MNLRRLALAGAVISAVGIVAAHAAGVFPGFPSVGSTTAITPGPSYSVPMDTGLASGQAPQTVLAPVSTLGNYGGTPRNYLGNGALNITNTNGTATVTCAQNAAVAVASLSADRWGCQANVAVGAGRTAIVTATPSPPIGFVNSMKVFRTSGALTQPVCVIQEVPTPAATALAGQVVTFSFQATGLAGLVADNGGVINAVLISGTGTDQGLTTSPTASPAITPAWTGITTIVNQPFTIVTTATPALTFARYFVSATIPATATEVGAMLCFTPTATGAGATDGFAFTGAQLEIGASPSPFEFQPKSVENADAQRYFYSLTEAAAAGGSSHASGTASTATVSWFDYHWPQPMYLVPATTFANGFATCSTTACTAAAACTTLALSTTAGGMSGTLVSIYGATLSCTTAANSAAGSSMILFDAGGTGKITAWTGL